MLRTSLATVPVAVALASLAAAQAPADLGARLQPIQSAVRDAGTFHVGTGAWTRRAGEAALGADILYNNTCPSGYFASFSGDTYVDEGRIPGPTSPSNPNSAPGCATSYTVDGFQLGYCTDEASPTLQVAFYDVYTACATTIGLTPAGSYALSSLPGDGGLPTLCWLLNVDVSGTPFTVSADATSPIFGWSLRSSSPLTSLTGSMIAGAPGVCTGVDGTSWDPTPNLAENGTGMGTLDQFRIEGGPTTPGCYFFGGTPFGSFHLELYGDACAPDAGGQASFCVAGAVGTSACPCANTPAASAGTGCLHSFGIGARLAGSGTASLGGDALVLAGTQMPPTSACLYFQGTLRLNGGLGLAFGDGLRCVGGSLTRLGSKINSGGASQYPSVGDASVSVQGGVAAPGVRTYQVWYRNIAAFCTPSGFNLSNGWEVVWTP